MIEQNTDRSWGGISSLVVGVILLATAKEWFPKLMEMIFSFFEEQILNESIVGSISVVTSFLGFL